MTYIKADHEALTFDPSAGLFDTPHPDGSLDAMLVVPGLCSIVSRQPASASKPQFWTVPGKALADKGKARHGTMVDGRLYTGAPTIEPGSFWFANRDNHLLIGSYASLQEAEHLNRDALGWGWQGYILRKWERPWLDKSWLKHPRTGEMYQLAWRN